jgi:hypothetical protein
MNMYCWNLSSFLDESKPAASPRIRNETALHLFHNQGVYKAALKCSKCGSKKLAVKLHGVGVKSLEA